jgi:Xaa-Pro aminopeptidase
MHIPRITALRKTLNERAWDAFIVSQPENRRYVSGFTGSAGFLLIAPDLALLLTDFRYIEQARKEAPDFEVIRLTDGLTNHLPQLVREHSLKTIAFESDHITVAQLKKWQESASDVDWIAAESAVETLRMIKDDNEVQAIRRAVRLADEAFAHLARTMRPHTTELEAAWELESYMRTHGAEKVAFDLIVGSGLNGAMPHATSSAKEILPGEPIVIDIGAVVDGYHSDMTRTVCLGQPDERFLEVYDVVLRAQETAEKTIRPGMTGQEADEIARQVITDAGFGPHFGHGLGHGVGIAIHEGPRLGQTSTEVLQSGMVVTIEPGIYLPDWGGVRIEDLAVIVEDGCEILTATSKNPIINEL